MKYRKRIIAALLLTLLAFSVAGCAPKEDPGDDAQDGQGSGNGANPDNITVVNNISMAYGGATGTVIESDKDIVDALTGAFEGLDLQEADEDTSMDLSTMLSVHFYNNDVLIGSYFVDQNGTFRKDIDPKFYKLASGTFDYDMVKGIYDSSEKQ